MNSDELIEKLEKLKGQCWNIEKKILKTFLELVKSGASYLIALYVYLWIYDVYGWERTLIAIGVGFIVFSMRSRISNA